VGVAEALGQVPTSLQSIRIVGPGSLGESVLTMFFAPPIPSASAPRKVRVANHPALVYAIPGSGAIAVASHETGPEIFIAVAAGVASAAVWDGVRMLIRAVWEARRNTSRGDLRTTTLRFREAYSSDGTVVREREVTFSEIAELEALLPTRKTRD
jgi:hypothetical protein